MTKGVRLGRRWRRAALGGRALHGVAAPCFFGASGVPAGLQRVVRYGVRYRLPKFDNLCWWVGQTTPKLKLARAAPARQSSPARQCPVARFTIWQIDAAALRAATCVLLTLRLLRC
jgi:hypothetical protein